MFFGGIKDKFPKKKKGQTHHVEIEVNPKGQSLNKTFEEFDQFFSDDEKTLVRLDKGRLSIHKLKPYSSWGEFYPSINLVFNSYIKNIKIKSIQRIGLRYINNFEIPLSLFDIEQYFNLRPALMGELPQNLASFMVGTIFVFENGRDNMKVQFLDNPSAIFGKTVFILDIDYFLIKSGSVLVSEADEWITIAHKNIEDVFEKALTDKTKQFFN